MTRRRILLLTSMLGILSMLGPVGIDMFVAFIPKIAIGLSADPNSVAQSIPSFMLGAAVGLLFHGALSDRFGRKPIILIILALFAISAIAAAFATSVEELIIWRFVQGIANSGGRVLANAVARDIFDREHLARTISDIMFVSALGAIFFPVVGGQMAQFLPWWTSFGFMALFAASVFVMFTLFFKESIQRKDLSALDPATLWSNMRTICRNQVYLWYVAISSFILAGFVAFLSASSTILIRYFGVSEGVYGFLFAAVSFSFVIGTFVSGRLVVRIGPAPLIAVGAIIAPIGGVSLAAFALYGIDTTAAVVIPMCIYIIGMALVFPQAGAAALQPFPTTAGLASSILGFINSVFAAAVSFGLNTFDNDTAIPMGMIIAAASLLCAVVVFFGVRPATRHLSTP